MQILSMILFYVHLGSTNSFIEIERFSKICKNVRLYEWFAGLKFLHLKSHLPEKTCQHFISLDLDFMMRENIGIPIRIAILSFKKIKFTLSDIT